MKTIIAGSRDIDDYAVVAFAVKKSGYHITEVVSGAARGVDRLGEVWAERNDVQISSFPANWKKHGKSAGYKRNAEMVVYADALIAIWDGESRGTAHTIKLAKKHGLKVFVFLLKKDYHMDGIPSIEEQEALVEVAAKKLKGAINEFFPKSAEEHKPFRLMVKKLLPVMRDTPASGRVEYHSPWAGGLLVHTVKVMELSRQLADQLGPDIKWKPSGEDNDSNAIRNAFMRSILKVGFLHDIGKIGNGDKPYYYLQESDWHKEKLGELYTVNRDSSELPYLPVPIRGIWLAHKYGVFLTEDETQAIIASDGPHTVLGKQVIATLLENPITMILHFADKWVSQVQGV